MALMKLNNFAEEVKEVQNCFELGKKAWEAERIALAERHSMRQEWEAEKIALTVQIGKQLLHEVTIKILAKERKCSISKCNQAFKVRDLALNELNNFGAELKEV